MKVVIDTSSLLSLVRYYLPFDRNSVLFDFFKAKFESGEIIILDRVFDECKYMAKGTVLSFLGYLKDKDFKKVNKLPVKTDNLIPPSPTKFYNQVENQFINQATRNKLVERS